MLGKKEFELTEDQKKDIQIKFVDNYKLGCQGRAILNTEEETEDRSLTTAIIIVCIMVSLACLKYIVL